MSRVGPHSSSGATTRTGTARGKAWSSPPPTCTSWRAGSSPTTGPFRTRGRSPWGSVSSRPPAWPATVRGAGVTSVSPQSPLCRSLHLPPPVSASEMNVNPTSPSGLADADENCKRFTDRCMPEAFKKVSRSGASAASARLARVSPHCPRSPPPAADQQRRAQVGHRDPRGHLQHADAAGGAGGGAGEARPGACEPDGSPDYGEICPSVCLS